MFIETLEFTIPVDLCELFNTMKRGPHSNLEFPASVNSYGTTQDASVQVVLRSNKLTFKVDGVSSDASMISKSECKTLKLSIFDVDRSLMPQEQFYLEEVPANQSPVILPNPAKRLHETAIRPPPHKSRKTSSSESNFKANSARPNQNQSQNQNNSHPSTNSRPQTSDDSHLNVKQEPEDPDLIEIEPDPEPDDIEPKREKDSFMQIDYSSNIPHTQTSQAALDRLSFNQQSSHSQSPASSTSSFHQNIPHVPDYAEPGPSQQGHHGNQNADDYLVFQDQDENDDYDNEADLDNDGFYDYGTSESGAAVGYSESGEARQRYVAKPHVGRGMGSGPLLICPHCPKAFRRRGLYYHIKAVHENAKYTCQCGKSYKYQPALASHQKKCPLKQNL